VETAPGGGEIDGAIPSDGEPTSFAAEEAWSDPLSVSVVENHQADEREDQPAEKKKVGIIRRCLRGFVRFLRNGFDFASLVGLLAVCAAVPIVQLVTLGYLLSVAGRIASGSTVREALSGLRQAGKIGLAVVALFILSIPTQVLANWEAVSAIVEPGRPVTDWLRRGAIATSLLAMAYLSWAWIRGGRLVHYLWPQPLRFLRSGWRPSTWRDGPDRFWEFTSTLELPRLFWLGLRGALATLVWLAPAMVIILANRNGETGLAGLVGAIALMALGIVMMYLPMLQVNFATENRVRGMYRVRQARDDFRRAPWAWFAAMVIGLLFAPIPLYLLKIEAIPQEVVWLPCLVFVALMLPARIVQGLAIRRARSKPEIPKGKWAALSRWMVRLMMPAVVGIYLIFVYVSQYTSWNGLETWIQQHAILVPFPFLGV